MKQLQRRSRPGVILGTRYAPCCAYAQDVEVQAALQGDLVSPCTQPLAGRQWH